jgi:putative ATP-dependent endonuclease of the OLD family
VIIESIYIKNFRSILEETLYCEDLTALVGANGSGKSSFLHALELFYGHMQKVDSEDFYNEDITKDIIIALTFKELKEEKEIFSKYIQNDKLNVERIFTWNNGKVTAKYHGFSLQNPRFKALREAFEIKDRGKKAKEEYEILRTDSDYVDLPPWSNLKTAQENIKSWEEENHTKCDRCRDDGQFFGFNEVGLGYLGKFTKFLFIPAIRDASSDAAEGRGSVITDLMDLVVRSVLAQKDGVKELKEGTQRRYQELVDPTKLPELKRLAESMTETLKTFVPDAKVDLKWLKLEQIDIPLPRAEVKLVEDGYPSAVARTGHGLQRAFILTMLQHLALAQTVEKQLETEPSEDKPKTTSKLPNLVLAIEEPELYQHPNRQRHFAKILMQISNKKIPGVAERTQIIYGTHSPLFVGVDRIEQIRLLRKISIAGDKPKITKIFSTDLDEVGKKVWEIEGKPTAEMYTKQTTLPRLKTIMTPWMNEGFFADIAILVEGEDDRAAILGIAKANGYDLEGNGFSVIPCGGKTNISRPYIIFDNLHIPLYIIWDGDFGKGETQGMCKECGHALDKKPDPKENHKLLRLMGKKEEDWPEYIEEKFACFKTELESTLENEIGHEVFENCLGRCQSEFCIAKRKHAIKYPSVITTILKYAKDEGNTSKSMDEILLRIMAFKDIKGTK